MDSQTQNKDLCSSSSNDNLKDTAGGVGAENLATEWKLGHISWRTFHAARKATIKSVKRCTFGTIENDG